MRRYILQLLFFSFIVSCTGNNFSNNMSTSELKLLIYPSGGGSKGYVIVVKDGVYKVMVSKISFKDMEIVLDDVVNVETFETTKYQYDYINESIKQLEAYASTTKDSQEFVLDAWVYVIELNGDKKLEFYGNFLELEPSYVKELIDYLIKISPIGLDLDGFS